jgi:pimeloyl-ACP methyl ester carboxylesterase
MNAPTAAFEEHRFRANDGLELYYRDYGDRTSGRTPVVCLTGLTRNSKDFHDLAMRLCKDRRVVCPDYRGRGQSAWDPDYRNYKPETYVADILDLLAAANLQHVVIIGTSLGGLLAMVMGAVQPAALAGVMLNDVGPEIAPGGASRIAGYVGKDVRFADYDAAAEAQKAQFGGAYPDVDDGEWLTAAKRTYVDDGEGRLRLDYDLALGKALAEQASNPLPDLWPMFRALSHVPVLAIRGGLSDVLSEATFKRMAEEMPGLKQVTLANRGHVPNLDEPECLAAIDDFFSHV